MAAKKKAHSKGHVPLKVLKKRAEKLNAIVARREKDPKKWK